MFVWDERKRRSNLEKHKLDFEDAGVVYYSQTKATFPLRYPKEPRFADIAVAEFAGRLLTLIYTHRANNIRVISFRIASRRERAAYERDRLGKG